MRVHEIVILGWLMAGEAGFMYRLVTGFAIFEIGEGPTARSRVLLGVLHHELDVYQRARDEGFRATEARDNRKQG